MKKANHRNLLVKPKIKVKQFKKCANPDCSEMINLKSKYCWDHKGYLKGVNIL